MSDWADERAQEWLDKHDPDIWHHRHSLAALLREVKLAEHARGWELHCAEVAELKKRWLDYRNRA